MSRSTPRYSNWQKVMATDSVATSFSNPAKVTTKRTKDGTVGLGVFVVPVEADLIYLYPTTQANAGGASMRVWSDVSDQAIDLWMPTLLLEVAYVSGNIGGTSGAEWDNTMFLADTIVAVASSPAIAEAEILSPATVGLNDVAGVIILANLGFEQLLFNFDRTGATDCNCLVRWSDSG